MFSPEYQDLEKLKFQNNNSKPLHTAEKIAQDIIDKKPFLQLELLNDFSISSNKRLRSDRSKEESKDLDNMLLLVSKTTDFLTNKEVVPTKLLNILHQIQL